MQILKPQQPEDWTRENGKEKLWYAENRVGYIYFSSPMTAAQGKLKPGFMLKSTTSPREMDRIYDKLNAQEREHNEKFMEALYHQGRAKYEATRSVLMAKLSSAATSPAEKNLIREALKLMDDRDYRMQHGSVTGVAAIQETEAPLEGKRTRIM